MFPSAWADGPEPIAKCFFLRHDDDDDLFLAFMLITVMLATSLAEKCDKKFFGSSQQVLGAGGCPQFGTTIFAIFDCTDHHTATFYWIVDDVAKTLPENG